MWELAPQKTFFWETRPESCFRQQKVLAIQQAQTLPILFFNAIKKYEYHLSMEKLNIS